MRKPSKHPRPEFLSLQRLQAANPATNRRDKLRALFERDFGLHHSRAYKVQDWVRSLEQRDRFCDHTATYRYSLPPDWPQCWFFLTEPYSFEETDPIIQRLEGLGCSVLDLKEWAMHYPGRAACYGVLIPFKLPSLRCFQPS